MNWGDRPLEKRKMTKRNGENSPPPPMLIEVPN